MWLFFVPCFHLNNLYLKTKRNDKAFAFGFAFDVAFASLLTHQTQ
tara:strand:+ start:237 stop:371 length:135 start_codon:yes stop_codon:yes gene_type:complete